MRTFRNYKEVVAIKEKSAGNDSVGSEWVEAATFPKNTPISEIVAWAEDASGKLIIAINESTADDKFSEEDNEVF